ncbi:MAG: ATP-binding protein [Myxococcales bacterium]|nr:ATP-binding protein [Myxococcales bacterium]
MSSTQPLQDLGERYWALGLPAAATSALARALAIEPGPEPAIRLTEIAMAQGESAVAKRYAAIAVERAPGPQTRLLLGAALLAGGELTGARRAFSAVLDARGVTPAQRARAHVGLSRAAAQVGDAPGASAQAGAALEALVPLGPEALAVELPLIEEVAALLVGHGRGAEALASLPPPAPGGSPGPLGIALLMARATTESSISDAAIEAALAAEEAARPTPAIAMRRLERRLRRRLSDDERTATIAELEGLAEAVLSDAGGRLEVAERARAWFLLAKACEDDPQRGARAMDSYRRGLALQPGHVEAACRLALLLLARGDAEAALGEIERVLRVDHAHGTAWRNAARLLDVQSPTVAAVVGRILDAAAPGAGRAAGSVAPHLLTATVEVVRHDVLAGVYAHGHRVKNLLGIIGARARSARKLAQEQGGDVADRLRDLESDVTSLYEEWALYLRSMQEQTPTVERVPLGPLMLEVVAAAGARNQHVPITIEQAAGLPDVRGDRMLLREALMNVVSNAAEACAATSSDVTVRLRSIAAAGGGAPLVEIEIADRGPGIARAHLGRLFVPGFTTKETGSGVGLAIAERVITAHHGRISVDSAEGQGTTVIITLPTDVSVLSALGGIAASAGGRS